MFVTFTVPGIPVGKQRPRFDGRHKRTYTPTKTVRYENHVGLVANCAMVGKRPIDGPVALTVTAYLPIPASWPRSRKMLALEGKVYPTVKPDGDNIVKAIKDALNGIVWKDDAQAVDTIVRKRYAAVPSVHVLVVEL